uniref:Uncharacterized protein n=1 Tax=Parascaris equorum TaxID=6256 RepID=A0A914RIW1_PAREQ
MLRYCMESAPSRLRISSTLKLAAMSSLFDRMLTPMKQGCLSGGDAIRRCTWETSTRITRMFA